MTHPTTDPGPSRDRTSRPFWRVAFALAVAGCALALLWSFVGAPLWSDYQKLRGEQRAAEDAAPVGYIGLNYRRTYNDRPAQFLYEEEGRNLLWAAKGEPGERPHFYEITGADFNPKALSGGYGRDSIPGVDYPIYESPDSSRGKNLRDHQGIFGVVLGDRPRAYPKDLLEKVEVVNDREGPTPFVVVYDRSRQAAMLYRRVVDGRELTFGTTGYSSELKPLLYDRATLSLWLPTGDALACVSGAHKGTRLLPDRTPEPTTWQEWRDRYPATAILMGNDRSKPIPTE